MLLTFRYRVRDATSGKWLARQAASVNRVWNYCGSIQNDSRRLNRHWPSGFDLIRLTSGASRELGLHSDTVQAVCKQFAASRDKAKRRPRWRASGGAKRALGWVPFQCARPLKVSGSRTSPCSRKSRRDFAEFADAVTFLGKTYRLWLSRSIPGDIRSGSFSEDADGRWFLNLVCAVADDLPAGTGKVGIDLGLKHLAALSTGETIRNPRHVRRAASKLARAQRAGRRALARRIHRKVAAQRRHVLHEQSARIAWDNVLVCVGNVNSAPLARTRMAKSVLDAGWSAFRSMLSCKTAMRRGARFVETNERYSTQTCSCCGSRAGSPKGVKGLGVRSWVCEGCGVLHDRDLNAARNILASGRNIALRQTEILVL